MSSLYIGTWEMSVEVPDDLSDSLRMRILWKARLVHRAVDALLEGMVKGTLKYGHEEWDAQDFLRGAMADAAHTLNYICLAMAATERAD